MSNQLVPGDELTASNWNDVERRKPTSATVATSQTTVSTSFTDLTTVGPSVTVTTGTAAVVIISTRASASVANDRAIMGFAVSGATTQAATDTKAADILGTAIHSGSMTVYVTGLTAGSNTFTAKYRSTASGSTATFQDRNITVIPM